MAYREVLRMEVAEVVRRWQAGNSQRNIASGTGLSRDTVRKYLAAAKEAGVVLINVNYFCRFRQLFLPVHHLFLTTLPSHSGSIAGDVEFQDYRVVDHPVDGRCGCHWVAKMCSHWEKTRLEVIPRERL